ncbi:MULTISPECIES: hypothetical protein [unclassified Nonomuraea]|uniref:hypothetical protein n=1 Tax=unclassified Nonomuraea TaxID=2593643 RepID=UPI0033FF0A58
MTSLDAAEQLRRELAQLNVPGDVRDGFGMALVSVWVGLVVWCRPDGFWWRTGWEPERERAYDAWHPLPEPGRAARRVAFRYAELRRSHERPALTAGARP